MSNLQLTIQTLFLTTIKLIFRTFDEFDCDMQLLYAQENEFNIELLRSDKDDGSAVEQMDGVEEEITSGPFKTKLEWLVWYLLLWQHGFVVSDSFLNKLLRFIVVFFGC